MGCSSSQEKVLIQSLQDEKAQLVSINSTLLSQLNSCPPPLTPPPNPAPELGLLKDQILSLTQQISELKLSQKSCLLKSLSRAYQKSFTHNLSNSFQSWLSFTKFQKPEIFTLEPPDPPQFDEECLRKAELLISEDFSNLIKTSPVWDLYLKHQDSTVAPMSIQKVLKLFEEMLDLKHAQDLRDLQEKRKPKTVPEFFIDFLNRSFGLKHLALKSLNQIMPVLLNNVNSGVLELFCKFLHIKVIEPAGYTISLFLIKIRNDFNILMGKSGNKVGKGGRDSQNSQSFLKVEGGAAYLSDVFVLVYSLFEKNRLARSLLVQFLQPESVSTEDYFLFHVCFKMARAPISPEELFDLIDSKKLKILPINTLVNGISRVLDLGLNSDTLKIIISILDPKSIGKINKESFALKLSQKAYLKNVKSEKFTVSKFRFLNCTLEVYNKLKLKNLAVILNNLKDTDQEFYEFEEFKSTVKRIDESVSEEFLEFLFEELANAGVGKDGIAKVLTEYSVGCRELKSFGKGYLAISGMNLGFEKRRSEVIEGLLEECKSMGKFANY